MEGSGFTKDDDLDRTEANKDTDEMYGSRHRCQNKIGCSGTLLNSTQLTNGCRKEGAIFQGGRYRV